MTASKTQRFMAELRKVFWPIEWKENKKFLPMAAMMFCILLNYSMLRSIKDGFVVTAIGPESISFLKTYAVLPMAVIAMVLYAKLCNVMSMQKVFYTVTAFFLAYFACFAFLLYPNPELVHPNPTVIAQWSEAYPTFQWFIKVAGHWSYATFYVFAELWGSMMLSLLFWQFANQITKTEEAKRFYSMFGLLGNFALPLTALILTTFLHKDAHFVAEEHKFIPVLMIVIFSGMVVMGLYAWINKHVLTDPSLYSSAGGKTKKSKTKLSLSESFKLIFSSKYLGLIVLLVIAYGVSINLVEGVWKAKIKELYPTKEEYTMYMAWFQAWQGGAAILFMIVGSNILRRVTWGVAAMLTPLMILLTGIAFFGFVLFDDVLALYLTGLFASGPLAMAVVVGMIQNVLSKATKYSLFDSTKEMAYIPLDDELKSKGKAAVDVVGARFGKSGGGIIQSTFFMLLPTYTFAEATPYFAGIFFVIMILWVYAVKALSTEYKKQIALHSY